MKVRKDSFLTKKQLKNLKEESTILKWQNKCLETAWNCASEFFSSMVDISLLKSKPEVLNMKDFLEGEPFSNCLNSSYTNTVPNFLYFYSDPNGAHSVYFQEEYFGVFFASLNIVQELELKLKGSQTEELKRITSL